MDPNLEPEEMEESLSPVIVVDEEKLPTSHMDLSATEQIFSNHVMPEPSAITASFFPWRSPLAMRDEMQMVRSLMDRRAHPHHGPMTRQQALDMENDLIEFGPRPPPRPKPPQVSNVFVNPNSPFKLITNACIHTTLHMVVGMHFSADIIHFLQFYIGIRQLYGDETAFSLGIQPPCTLTIM